MADPDKKHTTAALLSPAELATLTRASENPQQLERLLTLFAAYSKQAASQGTGTTATENTGAPSLCALPTTTTAAATSGSATAGDTGNSDNGTAGNATSGDSGNSDNGTTGNGTAGDSGSNAAAVISPFALLAQYVDASHHDLREWLRAIDAFLDWLEANQRGPQPLPMLLAYLSCTAQAQENSPMPLPLPHILADMLEMYGYDGDTAISSEPE